MASTQTNPHAMGDMSILAQAKPAIISSANQHSNGTEFELCDKIQATYKMAHSHGDFHHTNKQDDFQQTRRDDSDRPKVQHIEDEHLISRQNASNQMRQAAVMNAIASQQHQKQRLSATERLAMTAKRSALASNQRTAPNGQLTQANQTQVNQALSQPQPVQHMPTPDSTRPNQPAMLPQVKSFVNEPQRTQSSKLSTSTSMPTLETLLAVQRQLQRHTRQNLHPPQQHAPPANKPQDLLASKAAAALNGPKTNAASNNNGSKEDSEHYYSKQFPNLSRPTSNPREQNNYVTSIHETYDKELPPLPASISPSSYTNTSSSDDSQMNSLESQSSPPTSLVSLPPPPPPISSYLQQYDQVTRNQIEIQNQQNEQKQLQFTSSQPQTTLQPESLTNCRPPVQIPPTKQPQQHLPTIPVKHQIQQTLSCSSQTTQATSSQLEARSKPPPPMAPRPKHLAAPARATSIGLSDECTFAPPPPPLSNDSNLSAAFTNMNLTQSSQAPLPPPPVDFAPEPSGGFDEPDCASLRFPTPPPPELLLDDGFSETSPNKLATPKSGLEVSSDDEDDEGDDDDDDDDEDDFQCRIPTPPEGQKSMSFVSFQDLSARRTNLPSQGQLERFFSAINPSGQQQRALFNSSSFSVPIANQLCKQESDSLLSCQSQRQPQQQQPDRAPAAKIEAPQLTVCVGDHDDQDANSNGLLSTAASLHRYREDEAADHRDGRRQQLMMMRSAMTVASSSSPSSSSDGDGHSSNSSSSTSGVPSSIDSPSLKSESLDFNYGQPTSGGGVPLIGGTGNGPATSIMLAEQQQRQRQQQHAKFMAQRNQSSVDFAGQHRFNEANVVTARLHNQQQQQTFDKFAAISRPLLERLQQRRQQLNECMAPPPSRPLTAGQRRNSSSSINSTSTVASANGSVTSATTTTTTNKPANKLPRPALKQKKCVSFSDRVELVACAEEQCDSHLPNPLLARVLATQIDPSTTANRRNKQPHHQQEQQQQQQRHPNRIAS